MGQIKFPQIWWIWKLFLACCCSGSQIPCNWRQRANPKTGLIFVTFFFHPRFQDLQSALGGPGYEYSIVDSVVWSVALTALPVLGTLVSWSGYQMGDDGAETWRYSIRSQNSLNFSPIILTWQADPFHCRLLMVCVWVTISLLILHRLVRRSSGSTPIGALWFSFGSHKGNDISYLSLAVVFKCRHVHFIFCVSIKFNNNGIWKCYNLRGGMEYGRICSVKNWDRERQRWGRRHSIS